MSPKKTKESKKSDKDTALAVSIKAEMARVKEAFSPGPLFRQDPADVEPPVALAAWSVLDTLEDVIKQRKEAYRLAMLSHAEKNGDPTPKGGNQIQIDGSKVVREKRQNKMPEDNADFRLMLAVRNIGLPELFDEVKVLQMNASKLDYLIDSGRLSQAEVDKFKKVAYALKVDQSEIIEEVLEELTNQLLGVDPNTKRLKSV